jgi:hypothetical protein
VGAPQLLGDLLEPGAVAGDEDESSPRAASWRAYSWPMPAVAPVIKETLMAPAFQDGAWSCDPVRHNGQR